MLIILLRLFLLADPLIQAQISTIVDQRGAELPMKALEEQARLLLIIRRHGEQMMSPDSSKQMSDLKMKILEHWTKLDEHDLTDFDGNVDRLVNRIQRVYGYSQERAAEEYKGFKHRYNI